uniref:Uncharacterized protein n=1 Tax=Timema douglasi TaxID=61478 RepID=A0A7R8ZEL8_TIMDO|nr:unnamed protein product [Timema douglasi]
MNTGALNPRSTDNSGGNVNLLETALSQAETLFEDLKASLNGSSPENLLSTLRNHSNGILEGLSRFAGELKTEVEAHTGNLSTVLQTASVNFNETLNSLKTPKVQETVSQLQNQFQSGLETLKEESKKFPCPLGLHHVISSTKCNIAMEHLIQSGQDNPLLYDTSNPDYIGTKLKDELCEQIAT